MLLKAHMAFREQVQTNASYHAELNTRLSQLLAEIADGVKPEAIVKTMTESFRQQIQQTGLQETQTLLSAAAGELRTTTRALDAAVKPISERYHGLAREVEEQAKSLTTQSNDLASTTDKFKLKMPNSWRKRRTGAGGRCWLLLSLHSWSACFVASPGSSAMSDLWSSICKLSWVNCSKLPAALSPLPAPKKQKKGQ